MYFLIKNISWAYIAYVCIYLHRAENKLFKEQKKLSFFYVFIKLY